jgi:hypothetical protein
VVGFVGFFDKFGAGKPDRNNGADDGAFLHHPDRPDIFRFPGVAVFTAKC